MASESSRRTSAHPAQNSDPSKLRLPCRGCPNGCSLVAWRGEAEIEVAGNHCRKGIAVGKEAFLAQEKRPFRGKIRLHKRWLRLSVFSRNPVSREEAKAIRKELGATEIAPPVEAGAIVYTTKSGIPLFAKRTAR